MGSGDGVSCRDPCHRFGPVLGPLYDVVPRMRALPHREVAVAIRPAGVRVPRLVMTAARWAEWTAIARNKGVWTVPHRRTRANREHRVPLCRCTSEILDAPPTFGEGTRLFLFPNWVSKQLEEKQLRRMLRKLQITGVTHGFRSSFRDWTAEERTFRTRSSRQPSRRWSKSGTALATVGHKTVAEGAAALG